jgi:predicted nuclease with RNAse H fold
MGLERSVAGIDIGGDRKGNHLVILRGRKILRSLRRETPEQMLQECIDQGVAAVGIDAPCEWRPEGAGRHAERTLAQQRIFCFATPTREHAISTQSGFYRWMLNGERVYETFAEHYQLFSKDVELGERVCFETFPHAIACAFLGREIASAKKKVSQRREILEKVGIEVTALKSIDAVDAALCALTAKCLLEGKTHAYGDEAGGFIVVPALSGQRQWMAQSLEIASSD